MTANESKGDGRVSVDEIAEKINNDLVHENLALRRELKDAKEENAKLIRLLSGSQQLLEFYGSIRNYPLPPVAEDAKWPGCYDGDVKL